MASPVSSPFALTWQHDFAAVTSLLMIYLQGSLTQNEMHSQEESVRTKRDFFYCLTDNYKIQK